VIKRLEVEVAHHQHGQPLIHGGGEVIAQGFGGLLASPACMLSVTNVTRPVSNRDHQGPVPCLKPGDETRLHPSTIVAGMQPNEVSDSHRPGIVEQGEVVSVAADRV
jgi:hypothetical protein